MLSRKHLFQVFLLPLRSHPPPKAKDGEVGLLSYPAIKILPAILGKKYFV